MVSFLFFQILPLAHCERNLAKQRGQEITIQSLGEIIGKITLDYSPNQYKFGRGWMEMVRTNKMEVGDYLLFSLYSVDVETGQVTYELRVFHE